MTARPHADRPVELTKLGPLAQLRAGRLGRRLPQLFAGLVLFGVSMALLIRGTLGVMPWDVLHQGIALHVPLTFGQVVIATSMLVLALWAVIRQAPGLGTVANAIVVGLVVDPSLAVIPEPEGLPARLGLVVAGVLLNGLASAMYIGAQLGPGPRDGLMTGFARLTGRSLRLIRTSIEVLVLAAGWLLGGVVGVGTVAYALAIGPLTQALLPWWIVRLPAPPPHR
ncbi:YczE/YyaS/YitT family protein [Granulicoccus sp. GXG6511]|uniref:membrane protein YczE n=1 Tax=Granulicoccus sp. GXG6511 TaxID=3381351 RepID=UPI003D7D9676